LDQSIDQKAFKESSMTERIIDARTAVLLCQPNNLPPQLDCAETTRERMNARWTCSNVSKMDLANFSDFAKGIGPDILKTMTL